jgi:hypothetical protein
VIADADAVRQWTAGELVVDALPSPVGAIEEVDLMVPDFPPAVFPGLLIRKIRPAGDDERAATDAGEGAGDAERIGKIGQAPPCAEFRRARGRGRGK